MQLLWVESSDLNKSVVHAAGAVMVMPYIDWDQAVRCADLAVRRANAEGLLLAVHDKDRHGFVAIVNQAFQKTNGDFFGYMAQDVFAGREWLSLAIDALQTQKAQFLGFNDGKWQGTLASFGLASRTWAQSNYGGDFFYKDYQRHFADAELTVLALSKGVYAYEPNSVLIEVDWNKENSAVDSKDRSLYNSRSKNGFDKRVVQPKLLNLFS